MNHPWSSCTGWFDFIESIAAESISTESTSTESTSTEQPLHPPPWSTPSNDEMDDEDDASDHHTPTAMHFEDIHPNTPSIFGFGPGFMDDFNADRNAEMRKTNIYHPFPSKEEWGLASWLLCSGLSMRAIDDFLALPMVRRMTDVIDFGLNKI